MFTMLSHTPHSSHSGSSSSIIVSLQTSINPILTLRQNQPIFSNPNNNKTPPFELPSNPTYLETRFIIHDNGRGIDGEIRTKSADLRKRRRPSRFRLPSTQLSCLTSSPKRGALSLWFYLAVLSSNLSGNWLNRRIVIRSIGRDGMCSGLMRGLFPRIMKIATISSPMMGFSQRYQYLLVRFMPLMTHSLPRVLLMITKLV